MPGDGDGDGTPSPANGRSDQKVPFYKLFTFADRFDNILMAVGSVCAVANGLSQPIMTLIFGKMIDSFGSSDQSNVVTQVSKVCIFLFQ